MKCKHCHDEKNQIKAGKTAAGRQKYKCKVCRKVYTPHPKKGAIGGYREKIKKQAIKLYLEGNSGRAVGKIWKIGKNMCLYWARKYAKTTVPRETLNVQVDVIEMDDLFALSLI